MVLLHPVSLYSVFMIPAGAVSAVDAFVTALIAARRCWTVA